mmetsp:Transcript_11893/g.20082  ORF Transcript_11893/g.20082 Transcript_11893/m.20082 type:complete len:184 (-) Transcript_11893:260-811(-)|eukprot:CAMPEP_0198211570 /NCGR_PEP_ID=MMETSP1445-20131203/24507_1 /TAXON_ID=36898 /ORGANISM="Pyramimonas sp., Strain CCMP2087" /LENGTH=183 /DNA_ID=CAMNT_0043885845 /DNA_START=82 /DNA_END=633 /DNA_ORIENTATION=+
MLSTRAASGHLSSVAAFRGPWPRSSLRKPRVLANRSPQQTTCHGLIDLPPTYGFVAFTGAASYFLVQWQAVQVSLARRKYDVKYPKMYEDDEDSVFNCYQRAHQNTLESYPAFCMMLLLGGLAYPLLASGSGCIWIAGRVVYSKGYYSGDPDNRMQGAWNNIGMILLWILTIQFGAKQLDFIP